MQNKEVVFEFISSLKKQYSIKGISTDVFNKNKSVILELFSKFSEKDRTLILNSVKQFNKTQLSIFSKLIYDSIKYSEFNSFISNKFLDPITFKKDFLNIKNEKFRTTINLGQYLHKNACEETYAGFYKGVVDRSLSIIKLNINGKSKFFLAKGGSFVSKLKLDDLVVSNLNLSDFEKKYLTDNVGTTHLLLDIENYDVFSLSSNKLEKVYSIDQMNFPSKEKNYINSFKKEMINYLNDVYLKNGIKGIDRIKRVLKHRKEKKKNNLGLNRFINNLHKKL